MITKILRKTDIIILALFLLVTAFSFLSLKSDKKPEHLLSITSGNKEYVYSLKKAQTVKIQGALGVSTIVIQDGKAFFAASPCDNKTCIHMGAVRNENDWAACLPNDIFIRIE